MNGADILEAVKREADLTRTAIETLSDRLMNKNETVLSNMKPGIVSDYKALKTKIKEQKDENESLYKYLLNLKKDSTETRQKIELC